MLMLMLGYVSTPREISGHRCCKFRSGLRYKPGVRRLRGLCSQGSAPAYSIRILKRRVRNYHGNQNTVVETYPHPVITDTPIRRTATKSQAKMNYKCLTEINSGYYGLSLMRTLTRASQGLYSVRY